MFTYFFVASSFREKIETVEVMYVEVGTVSSSSVYLSVPKCDDRFLHINIKLKRYQVFIISVSGQNVYYLYTIWPSFAKNVR